MEFSLSRFKNIETRQFKCEVVTPMFLGGADGKSAELRAASIKGALRFWWRALYGSDDIEDMKKREGEIFGSTEKKSRLSLRVDCSIKPELGNLPKGKMFKTTSRGRTFSLGIIDYLAYGLYEYKRGVGNVYIREHIPVGSSFKIILKYDSNIGDEILESFNALVSFGGLGSRSRNGFGSFCCEDSQKLLGLGKIKRELLDFSALSKESRVFVFNKHKNWIDALSEIGLAYKDARLSLENKHTFEKRALIAMPIEVKGENIPLYIRKGRHQKPYLLHINKIKEGVYQGRILFMPYEYKYYFFKNENDKKELRDDKFDEYFVECEKINDILKNKAQEVKYEF